MIKRTLPFPVFDLKLDLYLKITFPVEIARFLRAWGLLLLVLHFCILICMLFVCIIGFSEGGVFYVKNDASNG